MSGQDDSERQEDPSRPGAWRFGAAVVDERLAELQVDGRRIDLDRSSYDVLLALLRHAGEVVTKDELLEAGWPGRVVTENSLAKAIGRLRQGLGAGGEALRSVHGYGYRLAAAATRQPLPGVPGVAPAQEAAHLHPGDSLPHRPGWRLERRLGEGGGSVVFLARDKAGGEARAVKFATSEAGLRSLKREIALTRYLRAAKPDLATIAPLHGWNLAHAPYFLERPYFADGDLLDWASRRDLRAMPLQARIELCIGLCDAVAELHEAGILHKDLKPQNLYPVAERDGAWRLVLSDLGAGEALQPGLPDFGATLAATVTRTSQQLGSALYVAPEVIAGELPTQRSDVFALGVLLYQMAVGNLRRSLAPGWENEVADPLLREDIALAAASDPAQRPDARGLAERLRSLAARHAQREDAARRDAAMAQQARVLAQATRRRRAMTLASGLLALVLGLSLWQQQRTAQARAAADRAAQQARTEAERSRVLVAFLTEGVLRQADPFADAQHPVTLREAIDRAARDVDPRLRDDPQGAAAIHHALGAAYEGMNDYDSAVAQYRLQVAALRRVDDPGALADARASLCAASLWQGNLPRALEVCEQARDDAVRAGRVPDRAEVFLALADSRQGLDREALARLEPRMERIRRSGDEDLYGFALWFAGTAYGRLGRPVDVERVLRALVDVRRRQAGDPSMQLAWALSDHGKALLVLGEEDAGRAELARARAMFDQVGGPGHPHGYSTAVHLANDALARGRWPEAYAIAEPAYRALLKATSWQNWTIYAALAAMTAAAEAGDEPAARTIMREFDAVAAQGLDDDFPYLREAHWSAYAQSLIALRQPGAAAGYVRRLRALATGNEPNPLLLARVQCFEAELERAAGRPDLARRGARDCREGIRAAATARSPLMEIPGRLLASLGDGGAITPARRESGRSRGARSGP
jgi:non-specific serine/threonine protein kinase